MNIVQPFLNRARSHPLLSAISSHGKKLTYAELALRSHALATGLLQNLSLKRAQRVMICMENRAAFFETLFACWIAGL